LNVKHIFVESKEQTCYIGFIGGEDMLELYANIKKQRTERGWSQDELAKRAGYTDRSSIAKIEKGLVDLPQSKIAQFARIFGVTSSMLMGDDGISDTVDPSIFPNIHPIATKTFPLFDGIAAGEPRLMPDGITLYVDATIDIQADFVLKVHGDSMTGARINDGDYVFIRQQPEVENGEIAAVAIGDEATLKRFFKYGDMVVLRSENPAYKEMTYAGPDLDQVRVMGKAVAFQSDVR
jgi:repressor LexA